MRFICVFLLGSLLAAADLPKISYSKSFPGSVPAYAAIVVDGNGRAEYKESEDDDNPVVFQLNESEKTALFELTARLDYFTRPLEVERKLANTGLKTLRFENGEQTNEVVFNYSDDRDAQLLLDWFHRITETERHYLNLEKSVQFDKLGVNRALLLMEVSLDKGRIVAPQQFLPFLDRIVKNKSFLHMARERAANLAAAIRNGLPRAE